jgi:dUTPase
MRIAQLIIAQSYKVKMNLVKEISTNTKRGKQGFGSTGL